MSIGKTKVKFGREQEISSKEILTFERSLVSNLLFPGELTGAWINGKGLAEHWLYELGVYSNDRSREFSSFNQGTIILGKIGYDYSAQAGLDTAVASFHYMHNTEPGYKESDNNNFYASGSPAFTDSIALTNDITQGRFGLTTDILYGFGFEGDAQQAGITKALNQTDVFGISIIPSYYLPTACNSSAASNGQPARTRNPRMGLPPPPAIWAFPTAMKNGRPMPSPTATITPRSTSA